MRLVHQFEKVMQDLDDAGLVEWDENFIGYRITDAGRAAGLVLGVTPDQV